MLDLLLEKKILLLISVGAALTLMVFWYLMSAIKRKISGRMMQVGPK